jgi:hypothetical protein
MFLDFPADFAVDLPWNFPSRHPLGSRVVAAVDPVERPSSRRPQQGQHPENRRRTVPRRMAVLPALLPRERQGCWTLRCML